MSAAAQNAAYQSRARTARATEFLIGTRTREDRHSDRHVVWQSDRVVNPHMVLVGSSGVGKTHRIRSILSQIASAGDVRCHVIDVHGDLTLAHESAMRFIETGSIGLNPLKVNADHDFGGPRKKIRAFISMLSRTRAQLGPKQEAVLVNLLRDLYAANGFHSDDPRTWDVRFDPHPNRRYQKRQPSLIDLKRFAEYKLKQRKLGMGAKAVQALERLNKAYQKLERTNTANMKNPANEVDLDGMKAECIECYQEYIHEIENGREVDDLIKYDSYEVIKSVYDRIVGLESIGVFKDQPPPFDPHAPIWRYDVRTLSSDEQRMFVDVVVEELFFEAKRRGQSSTPHTFVVIDEAQKFMTDDEGHILNVAMREARKFGLAFILASQSLAHFPEDTIANAATKIILGVDESFHDITARRLKIDGKRLRYIVPQRTALVQVKAKASTDNSFSEVNLA